MKKFSFFTVLLVALFSFLSLDSYAQYKSVTEAMQIVDSEVVANTPSKTLKRSSLSNSNSAAISGMRTVVGKAILAQLKNNVSVQQALDNVSNDLVVDYRRQSRKDDAILYYRQLLLL